jgi:hypothetical protein
LILVTKSDGQPIAGLRLHRHWPKPLSIAGETKPKYPGINGSP